MLLKGDKRQRDNLFSFIITFLLIIISISIISIVVCLFIYSVIYLLEPSTKGWPLIFPKFLSTAVSSKWFVKFCCSWEWIKNVWSQTMSTAPKEGVCLTFNPNKEYGYFPKTNDIYLNLIPAVPSCCLPLGFQLLGFKCTNIP